MVGVSVNHKGKKTLKTLNAIKDGKALIEHFFEPSRRRKEMDMINAHNNVFKAEKAVVAAWKSYNAAIDDFGADSPIAIDFCKRAQTAQKHWSQAKRALQLAEQQRVEQLQEREQLFRRQGWLARALKATAAS